MGRQISNTILMTGAGFTKNFGGFLANEMWAKIFNYREVQVRPVLKNILLTDFNYESIYHTIFDGNYSDDEKETINKAVFGAYKMLDDIAQNYIPATDSTKSAILYGAKKIIDRLSWEQGQINFFFTLNQDLFVERLFSCTKKPITNPGIRRRIVNPGTINSQLPLNVADFITVPTRDDLDTTKHATALSHNEFHYIKLHGSLGWKSSDGSNKLVIGENKEKQIAKGHLGDVHWNID